MSQFNPNSPQVAGLEWLGREDIARPFTTSPGQTAIINSNLNETVDGINFWLNVHADPVKVQFDIYDAGNMSRNPSQVDAARPVDDVAIGSNWVSFTPFEYQSLDEIQLADMAPDDEVLTSSYIYQGADGQPFAFRKGLLLRANDIYQSRVDGSTRDPFTNRRVVLVRVRLTASINGDDAVSEIFPTIRMGQQTRTLQSTVLRSRPSPGFEDIREISGEWLFNPVTGFPWTVEEVKRFSVDWSFGIFTYIIGEAGDQLRVFNMQLEVVTIEDRRVAYANRTIANEAGQSQWYSFLPRAVNTGAVSPWAKQASKRYVIVGYAGSASGASWSAIVPHSGHFNDHTSTEIDISSSGNGVISAATFDVDDNAVRSFNAFAIVFRNGTDSSPDSQPYSTVTHAPVHATASVQQEISNTATLNYGQVTVLARPSGAIGGNPTVTAPLALSLRRRSDSALIAGPITVEASELGTVDGRFDLIERRFTSAPTLTAGTQYYVELTSATSNKTPWYAAVLSSQLSTFDDVTYGGGVDRASYGTPSAEVLGDDAPFSVKTVPPPLTNVVVTQEAQSTTLLTGPCAITALGYAALTWSTSTLGGSFFTYEVERLEGDVWVTVARPTAESSHYFNDFELPPNTATRYRARVVRTDGAFSDWALSNYVYVAQATKDLVLVTNEVPDLNVAYMSADPERKWGFPDGERRVLVPIYGADFNVAFRPYEKRGDSFQRQMVIAFNDPSVLDGTVIGGRRMFDALENIAHSVLVRYVCLRDGDGNRWYTSTVIVDTNEKHWNGGGHQYLATVQFDQVAGPIATTTSTPWAPGALTTLVYGEPGGIYSDGTYGSS